jgi:hypothetical protein
MDIYRREIERKFVVAGETYESVCNKLSKVSKQIEPDQTSHDLYWEAPGVDFVRLRQNSRELTVKVTDKGSIIDRVEENAKIDPADMPSCARIQTLLFGPALKLTKRFSVFELAASPAPGTLYNAILCAYQVEGDSKERVFFEVEAESISIVDYVLGREGSMFTLSGEGRSLYQIFREEGLSK